MWDWVAQLITVQQQATLDGMLQLVGRVEKELVAGWI